MYRDYEVDHFALDLAVINRPDGDAPKTHLVNNIHGTNNLSGRGPESHGSRWGERPAVCTYARFSYFNVNQPPQRPAKKRPPATGSAIQTNQHPCGGSVLAGMVMNICGCGEAGWVLTVSAHGLW